ncbi:MAG TPA: GNAT family protein [Terracidiphilus sp.]|nr:GNAT family protein [Terracidiphilus sp.]
MTNSSPDLAAWQSVPLPRPGDLRGRYTTLEPLNAARHSGALWEAMQGHDDLWRWMPASPAPGAEAMIAELEAWQQAAQALALAIVPADTGRAGGWAAFMRIEPAHGVIEVGNVMFSPALQRTRAATEAMYLMARHVFEDLGYRRYEWKCDADNSPSRRAALRLGFSFEGIFRQHRVVKGRNRDTAWFAMLDHEWPSRKRAFESWLDPANFERDGDQRQSLAALREGGKSTPSRGESSTS